MGRSEARVEKLEARVDSEVSRRHVLIGEETEDREACIRRHGFDPHDERHYYFVILGG
jgi:hypothetical protein